MKRGNTLIIVIALILIVVVGVLVFKAVYKGPTDEPRQLITPETQEDEILMQSDEIEDIEKDLNSTEFDDLDSDLNEIDGVLDEI